MRLVLSGAMVALLSFNAITPASAGSAVPTPRGFQIMCIDHPSECRGGGARQVPYDKKLAALIEKVNRQVNRRIAPVRNEVIDVWSVNVARGDCEEYVLAKRKALIAAGVPASALEHRLRTAQWRRPRHPRRSHRHGLVRARQHDGPRQAAVEHRLQARVDVRAEPARLAARATHIACVTITSSFVLDDISSIKLWRRSA